MLWFSTQRALLYLIEKQKFMPDKKGYEGATLVDLSKAFDTINHELLAAKRNAYGFSLMSKGALKDNESRCIALFVVSGSIKKLF